MSWLHDLFGPQSVVEMFLISRTLPVSSICFLLHLCFSAYFSRILSDETLWRNGYLGAAMGMAMVMRIWSMGMVLPMRFLRETMPYWNIFGLEIGASGLSRLGVACTSCFLDFIALEKFFHKEISAAFDYTFTPMLAIIITGFNLHFVGPVMRRSFWWFDRWLGGCTRQRAVGRGLRVVLLTDRDHGASKSFPAIETTLLDVARTGGSSSSQWHPWQILRAKCSSVSDLRTF